MKPIFCFLGAFIMAIGVYTESMETIAIKGPEGIAYWHEGNCYFASDAKEGLVYKIDREKELSVFSEQFRGEMLMIPVVVRDRLYVSANFKEDGKLAGYLLCWDLRTGALLDKIRIGTSDSLGGMAANRNESSLYILNQQGDLYEYSIASGTVGIIQSGLGGNGLCLAEEADTLLIASWGKKIRKFNTATKELTILEQTPAESYTFITACNGYYIASMWNNRLVLFDNALNKSTIVPTGPLRNPVGLSVGSRANELAVCNFNQNRNGTIQFFNLERMLEACLVNISEQMP